MHRGQSGPPPPHPHPHCGAFSSERDAVGLAAVGFSGAHALLEHAHGKHRRLSLLVRAWRSPRAQEIWGKPRRSIAQRPEAIERDQTGRPIGRTQFHSCQHRSADQSCCGEDGEGRGFGLNSIPLRSVINSAPPCARLFFRPGVMRITALMWRGSHSLLGLEANFSVTPPVLPDMVAHSHPARATRPPGAGRGFL